MNKYLLITILFLFSCNSKLKLKLHDTVTLCFRLENSKRERIDENIIPNGLLLPLRLKIGEDHFFAEVDTALIGMRIGEEKTIVINPENNYGNIGVFYRNSTYDTVYLIKPHELLYLKVKIITIN